MTKQHLRLAQLFYDVYERTQKLADEIDPRRKRTTGLVRVLDAIAVKAADGFRELTGRHPDACSLTDFHIVRPARWTKEVGKRRDH